MAAFLSRWVTAWNRRDAPALAALHTDDAVTINRYGVLLLGRAAAAEALSLLLGPEGPFGDVQFPPMQRVALREIAPGVAVVQANWAAPMLGPDGRIVPDQSNAMILSYTLLRRDADWRATQIDGHNIEAITLPFSASESPA